MLLILHYMPKAGLPFRYYIFGGPFSKNGALSFVGCHPGFSNLKRQAQAGEGLPYRAAEATAGGDHNQTVVLEREVGSFGTKHNRNCVTTAGNKCPPHTTDGKYLQLC